MRSRYKKITVLEPFSMKKRLLVFISILSGLFVIIEPLGVFGLAEYYLKKAGIYGYLGLISFSALITVFIEMIRKINSMRKYKFIEFTIILIQDGSEFYVKAPQSILVKKFIQLFLKKISYRSLILDTPITTMNLSLFVNNADAKILLDSAKTIQQCRLKNGDVCSIAGRLDSLPGYFVYDNKTYLIMCIGFGDVMIRGFVRIILNTKNPHYYLKSISEKINHICIERSLNLVSIIFLNDPEIPEHEIDIMSQDLENLSNILLIESKARIRFSVVKNTERRWIEFSKEIESRFSRSITSLIFEIVKKQFDFK